MTQLLAELSRSARGFAREGVAVAVVLGLTLGITASLALTLLERAEDEPS
jgi:hypothetical protein